MSRIEGVAIQGICDVRSEIAEKAKKRITSEGHEAKLYSDGEEAWKNLCDGEDVDLIYIDTHWGQHAEMAVYAMEHEKLVDVDVQVGTNVEDCWRLVTTFEETKKHCVILENCCYDFFELLTLNLARQGFFGDIVHCEGAYLHPIMDSFFEEDKRYDFWRLKENALHNGNLYPTHGLGPVAQILKINRGNRMEYLSSMSSKDFSLKPKAEEVAKEDARFKKYLGQSFRGNINVTNIMLENGSTVMLQHDVSSPRPYSRLHIVSGTKAYAQK